MKIKRFFATVGLVLVLVAALTLVLVVRALSVGRSGGPGAEEAPEVVELPSVGLDAVERLAGAIRLQTISRDGEPPPIEDLERLHGYLEESFPRAHAVLDRRVIGGGSLLFVWPPAGASRETPFSTAEGAQPLVLLAHMDTVPVTAGSEPRWEHPPFSGAVAEEAVWGRGTLDDKSAVTAALEAVEQLAADGFVPARPVILAFGHDEEVGGTRGARQIAAELDRLHVEPLLVVDEGQAVIEGLMPGVERPVAMIGIAEKGYVSLTLTAHGPEGHSSTPPPETAVDILAAGLGRLRAHPLPAGIDGPVQELFETLAPEMPFGQRLVMANLWLFEPLVVRQLGGESGANALIRTTTAPTMLEGSPKDNVLPAEARAVVNFRVHPRDSVAAVKAHVERVIGDGRILVSPYGGFGSEPSPVSPTAGDAYELLKRTVAQVVPEAVIAPSLVVGGTDARYYTELTENVYRFLPLTIGPTDLARIHGTDERIAITDYQRLVQFYIQLIRNVSAPGRAE